MSEGKGCNGQHEAWTDISKCYRCCEMVLALKGSPIPAYLDRIVDLKSQLDLAMRALEACQAQFTFFDRFKDHDEYRDWSKGRSRFMADEIGKTLAKLKGGV